MSASLLLLCAAFLLASAGVCLFVARRAERRRARAAGAFVDQHLVSAAAAMSSAAGGAGLTRQGGAAAADPRRVTAAKRPSAGERRVETLLERFPMVENVFLRAGIEVPAAWLMLHVGGGVLAILFATLLAGAFGALPMTALVAATVSILLWWKISKREKRIIRQIPIFLDLLIRQVTVGTSLGSAFQQIAPKTAAPLGELLNRAAQLNRAGVDLDTAVKQVARLYKIEPLLMIGSVLGVSTKFGGRSDQVLERIAGFMRDIEQAQDELVALSAETRMSAWILGALPLAVATFILIFNSKFFMGMWHDPIGMKMLLGAGGLQILGSFLLYRLAKAV